MNETYMRVSYLPLAAPSSVVAPLAIVSISHGSRAAREHLVHPGSGRRSIVGVPICLFCVYMSFFLVPTNATLSLIASTPPWGATWSRATLGSYAKLMDSSMMQSTRCCDAISGTMDALKHVVVNGLARHPDRTMHRASASVCIVAAPPNGQCEPWSALCPNLPLVVVDVADVDDFRARLCPTLWHHRCRAEDTVYRLVSSPGVVTRPRMSRCRSLTTPWLSHARSPSMALAPRERTVHIAFAGGVDGHVQADRVGFSAWRRRLRSACSAMKSAAQCSSIFQALAGRSAHKAIQLYARSVFCLQPPGDTIVRSAIVDAIAVGCIPVLFHEAQAALWPWHWKADRASVLFDWSAPSSSQNATSALHELLGMPASRVRALQAAVVDAARSHFYRGDVGPADQPDAIDALVKGMRRLAKDHHNGVSVRSWSRHDRRGRRIAATFHVAD